jgi:hypothetical protein
LKPDLEKVFFAPGAQNRFATQSATHPFVDILLSDIMESEATLDTSELICEPPPPSFQRMSR